MYKLIFSAVLAASLAACAGGDDYGVNAGYATDEGAGMVQVGPGVYAMQGFNEPLFYSGNNYWLYSNGGWYASPDYHGGWSYVARPPRVILGIRQPYAWMHGRYHAFNEHRYDHDRR